MSWWNKFFDQARGLFGKSRKSPFTSNACEHGFVVNLRGEHVSYDHVVVAELKQENANRVSLFYSLMKEHEIRPCGLSKYCIGAIALYPELKYNSFKEKIILIDKLI